MCFGKPVAASSFVFICSDIPLLTPTQRSNVKVPPPNMGPTAALRIDGFMRPFTVPQVPAAAAASQGLRCIVHECTMMCKRLLPHTS